MRKRKGTFAVQMPQGDASQGMRARGSEAATTSGSEALTI
jgi:hypothetical protein